MKFPQKRRSKSHYAKLVQINRKRFQRTFWERFFAKVEIKESGCWEWSAYTIKGYGFFAGKACHRLIWEMLKGPIPKGMYICHKCDNRRCCNPSHLFLGDHKANMDDREAKGRTASGPKTKWFGKFGTQSVCHKLTEESAKRILSLKHSGKTMISVAKMFGVSKSNIWAIWTRKTWPHIS